MSYYGDSSDDILNSNAGSSSNAKKKFSGISESDDSYDSFSQRNSKKLNKSSKSMKTDTDENKIDFTKLDAKISSLSSDDEERKKSHRRRPRSVANNFRTPSDDDDDLLKQKVKPKPKISARKPAESVAPTKEKDIDDFDDSASQRKERPSARTYAPSMSSYKSSRSRKWTEEDITENPLDRELKRLKKIEFKLTKAEQEKKIRDDDSFTLDNFLKSGDRRSQKRQEQEEEDEPTQTNAENEHEKMIRDDNYLNADNFSKSGDKRSQKRQRQEEEDEPTQTIAEAHYAKMLSKKFPQLVKKRALQHQMQSISNSEDNVTITNWSRKMIKNKIENTQNEIDQINKELKLIKRENKKLQEKIDSYS